jgi:hypothetical protein
MTKFITYKFCSSHSFEEQLRPALYYYSIRILLVLVSNDILPTFFFKIFTRPFQFYLFFVSIYYRKDFHSDISTYAYNIPPSNSSPVFLPIITFPTSFYKNFILSFLHLLTCVSIIWATSPHHWLLGPTFFYVLIGSIFNVQGSSNSQSKAFLNSCGPSTREVQIHSLIFSYVLHQYST